MGFGTFAPASEMHFTSTFAVILMGAWTPGKGAAHTQTEVSHQTGPSELMK